MGGPESWIQDRGVEEGDFRPRRRVPRAVWPILVGATWFIVAMVVFLAVIAGVGLYALSHSPAGPKIDLGALAKNCPTKTVTATYGDTVRLCDPLALSGLDEMTVYSLSPPTLVSVGSDGAPVQGEVTTADVGVCTGGSAFTDSFSGTDFELLFSNGSAVIPAPFHARRPELENLKSLGPHRCARGYVSFYTGRGSIPSGISYRESLSPVTYLWSTGTSG